jgi:hypothetical protein
MSLHDDATYQIPVFNALSGGRALPVLVVTTMGWEGSTSPYNEMPVPLVYMSAADFARSTGPLTGYSGVLFPSRDRCCFDIGADVASRAGDLAAFTSAGGHVGVEDYQGHPTWDALLHFAGRPGILSGLGTDLQHDHPCINPGVSTPAAMALGFKETYTEPDGCFAHHLYDPAFWRSHGFSALQTTVAGAASTTHSVVVPGREPAAR